MISFAFKCPIICTVGQVTVTATHSPDYDLTPLSGDQYSSCLCASERKTLRWTMAPKTLGEDLAVICTEWNLPHWQNVLTLLDFIELFRWLFAGVVSVSVTAEAVSSHISCNNDIVLVPERGRIDTVARTLIVKVGTIKNKDTHQTAIFS